MQLFPFWKELHITKLRKVQMELNHKRKRTIPKGWKEIKIGDVFRTSSGDNTFIYRKKFL